MLPISSIHAAPPRTKEEHTYQVCRHCGFRLMEVWLPTDATFPLPVEHCPICGYRRDANGITRGKPMTREEKLFAFDRWLWQHGLDRNLLQSHYHLRPEQFFTKGKL